MHEGIGGKSALIFIDDTPVFVKKVPLTDLEQLPHWRILLSHQGDININYWGNIEEYCQYWENSDVIRKRVENLNNASAHIALFLEYVPQNLHDWLNAQIAKGVESAETAVVFVDEQLKASLDYGFKKCALKEIV